MIEAQEISDKQVMNATKVEAQAASGRIRFITTLPSGRELSSEWIKESNKTQGVLKWCEAVRGAIVGDAEEEAAKTRRRLREQQQATSAPALPAELALPSISPSLLGQRGSTGLATPAGQTLSSDPTAFLEQALAQAEQTEAFWRGEALKANANHSAAVAALQKWRQIKASLSAGAAPSASVDIGSRGGVMPALLDLGRAVAEDSEE